MPKQGLTEIFVILDRSGSMESIKSDAIGGFNSFIEKQKALGGEAKLTLAIFDHRYSLLYDGKDINEVEPLNETTYRPSGWTALLDAVGFTIDSIGKRLAETPEDERPEKVIGVIITDGEENRSTEYTYRQISEKIEHQKSVYNWEFMFLGANIDSFAMARSIGVSTANTANFRAGGQSVNAAYSSVNDAVTMYRNSGTVSSDWSKRLKEEDENATTTN